MGPARDDRVGKRSEGFERPHSSIAQGDNAVQKDLAGGEAHDNHVAAERKRLSAADEPDAGDQLDQWSVWIDMMRGHTGRLAKKNAPPDQGGAFRIASGSALTERGPVPVQAPEQGLVLAPVPALALVREPVLAPVPALEPALAQEPVPVREPVLVPVQWPLEAWPAPPSSGAHRNR